MAREHFGEPTEPITDFREFKLQSTQEGETLKRLLISKTCLTPAKGERGLLARLLFVDINGPL